jgi:hypothetical protein
MTRVERAVRPCPDNGQFIPWTMDLDMDPVGEQGFWKRKHSSLRRHDAAKKSTGPPPCGLRTDNKVRGKVDNLPLKDKREIDRAHLHCAGDPIDAGLLEENSEDLRVVRLVDVQACDTA